MTNNQNDLHKIIRSKEYTRSYDTRYVGEVSHLGLGSYRILKDLDSDILDRKIIAQFAKWDEQWEKVILRNKSQTNKEVADERTKEAQQVQKDINELLLFTLDVDDSVDWEMLKEKNEFNTPNPKDLLQSEIDKVISPILQELNQTPKEPNKSDYQPSLSIIDKIFKSLGQKKIIYAENRYESAVETWKKAVSEIDNFNNQIKDKHEKKLHNNENQKKLLIKRYTNLEIEWKKQEEEYYRNQV